MFATKVISIWGQESLGFLRYHELQWRSCHRPFGAQAFFRFLHIIFDYMATGGYEGVSGFRINFLSEYEYFRQLNDDGGILWRC